MKNPLTRQAKISGMLMLLVAFALVAVADGHTRSQTKFLGSGANWCGFGETDINPPYGAAGVFSYQPSCAALKKKNKKRLRTKARLLKRRNGVFEQCRPGFWGYNMKRTASTATLMTWGSAGSPPCGSGRYKVQGFQGIKVGGNWKRGRVRSPGHSW